MSQIGLKGTFTETSYSAVVEIDRTAEICLLRVADLALEFVDAPDVRYTKDIRLTHLSLMGSQDRSQTFRRFERLEANLSREAPHASIRHDIVFQVLRGQSDDFAANEPPVPRGRQYPQVP